jgi:hypothetical protein
MKSMNRMKKAVLALAGAAVMVTGALSESARAFTFTESDLVLVLYGNRTSGEGAEALINLSSLTGKTMDQLTTGTATTNVDVSAYLNAAGVKDLNPAAPDYPVRYSVLGYQADAGTGGYAVKAGSATNLDGGNGGSVGNTANILDLWSNLVTDGNAPNLISGQNGAVVGFGNANSYTSRFGTAERMGAGFFVTMASNLDQLLYIVKGDSETGDPLAGLGKAMLSANGLFQITGGELAPVPVPAAVVLFGSGLIGLVGMARRNLFRQSA